MHSEARKLHVIEEVLKVKDEASLIEVESFLKRKSTEQINQNDITKNKPSDFAGCISKETARKLSQQIEESRNEWERGI